MMKRYLVIFMSGLIFASTATTTCAAEKKDKTARRMEQVKRQMDAEKAQLQAQFELDKTALEAKVQASEKASGEIKSDLATSSRRNGTLTVELKRLRKEKVEADARAETSLREMQASLDKVNATLADLTASHQITVRDLKANDIQRKEISKSLVQRDLNLATCTEKNVKLHDFGLELVKIYDKTTTYLSVLRTEPFTQLKRVELENVMQSYQDKLDQQQVLNGDVPRVSN